MSAAEKCSCMEPLLVRQRPTTLAKAFPHSTTFLFLTLCTSSLDSEYAKTEAMQHMRFVWTHMLDILTLLAHSEAGSGDRAVKIAKSNQLFACSSTLVCSLFHAAHSQAKAISVKPLAALDWLLDIHLADHGSAGTAPTLTDLLRQENVLSAAGYSAVRAHLKSERRPLLSTTSSPCRCSPWMDRPPSPSPLLVLRVGSGVF